VTSITSTGTGTDTSTISFESLQAGCYIGVGPTFTPTGTIHLEYISSGPATLYVVDGVALMAWTSGFGAGNCSPLPGVGYQYAHNIMAPSYPASGSFDLSLPSGTNLTFTGGSYYYSNYTMVMVAPLQEKGPNAVLSVGPTLGVFTIASSVEASRMLTISEATTLSIFSTITLEASMMQTYEAWIIAGIMAVVVLAVLWIVVDNSYRSLRICQTRT